MIRRFSFHKGEKGNRFLTDRLQGAQSYDRIAGYFNSSLLEFAGEAFESVSGTIRIICNSDLRVEDVNQAQKAEQAQKLSFFRHDPAKLSGDAQDRLQRLYTLLTSESGPKLEVKVLPNDAFGLIHGKAGVITLADGTRTSFLGSANETYAGWNLNYELVWEDDSEEACNWVQEEFSRLWQHHQAVPLSRAIVNEVKRLVGRQEINLENWRKESDPKGVVVEAPVYRQEFGLWPHQRSFVDLFWKAHINSGGRFVLGDQVGLGKTVQLGMAAQLMALQSELPVLVLLPKTLMEQWQTELWDLMEIPSARWNGKTWIDEAGFEHTLNGKNPLLRCPRKIGMISQGLVIRGTNYVQDLLQQEWEGVIVDEAHRARRRKLPKQDERGPALKNPDTEANKLYAFCYKLASRTRSMLLSTATPVQMHPIEAWDLLRLLSEGSDHVLGSPSSPWRRPENALPYLMGENEPPDDIQEKWDWLRNPLPPSWEDTDFSFARTLLNFPDDKAVVVGKERLFENLQPPLRTRMQQKIDGIFEQYNPFLLHIVRRMRSYLENTINPETNEPYLRKIEVKLIDDESLPLESYLQQGYDTAEQFCKLLAKRVKGAGFFKTLLLRRIGSSIMAGLSTVTKMLNSWEIDESDEEEDFEEEDISSSEKNQLKALTGEETKLLQECYQVLSIGVEQRELSDPKLGVIIRYLKSYQWIKNGCILFSQYYDTAKWIGEELVKEFPDEEIGLYAGSSKSGIWEDGQFLRRDREEIKKRIRGGRIKILLGTDAASEGLNLQALGNLINIDLPWNPTRLEQRKGRIQRIGQENDIINVLNLRYKDSVEDKVHESLSERLQQINGIFGQVPDVLKDVWVKVALDKIEEAEKLIQDIPKDHPFNERYFNM